MFLENINFMKATIYNSFHKVLERGFKTQNKSMHNPVQTVNWYLSLNESEYGNKNKCGKK